MHLGGYHRNHSLFIPSELIRVTRKGLGTGCGLHGEPPRTKPRTHSLTLWGPGRWQSEGQHPACHQAPRRAHLRSRAGPSRAASPMGSFERSVGTGAPRPELSSQALCWSEARRPEGGRDEWTWAHPQGGPGSGTPRVKAQDPAHGPQDTGRPGYLGGRALVLLPEAPESMPPGPAFQNNLSSPTFLHWRLVGSRETRPLPPPPFCP